MRRPKPPAASGAGDAAAAAYLHPLAKAMQVGHIVRAAANAAHAAELSAGNDPNVGSALIEQARSRATPIVIEVLDRYPLAPAGRSRVAHLMTTLDRALRTRGGGFAPGFRVRTDNGLRQ